MAAMSDLEIIELTKEKRKATSSPKKMSKRRAKGPSLIACPCGSTVPIPKGTKCPTCNVQTPEVISAKGKQPCQCGQRELAAGKSCDVCGYTWVNPGTKSDEVDAPRECSHCKRDTSNTTTFCDHCDKDERSGLTMTEMMEFAATGVATGPTKKKADEFKPDRSQMFPSFEEKQEARRAVTSAKRGVKTVATEKDKAQKRRDIIRENRAQRVNKKREIEKEREHDSPSDDDDRNDSDRP